MNSEIWEAFVKITTEKDEELKKWVATQGKKLRLKKSPTKPKNGFVFVDFLEEWDLFLKNV
jgi:hypothetical protein